MQNAVVPTKTNLLKIKKDLLFAQEGYALLEEKKEILVAELMGVLDRTQVLQRELEETLRDAYQSLEKTAIHMGKNLVFQATGAIDIESDIKIMYRNVMGVAIPIVDVRLLENPPYYSFVGTSVWLDDTVESFKKTLAHIASFAADKIALLRLAAQLKKTIHRINALEKIYIPYYKKVYHSIESILDEQERQAFFAAKLIKERLEQRRKRVCQKRIG